LRIQPLLQFLLVVEGVLHALDLLVGFVALAGQQDDVALLASPDRVADGFAPVGNDFGFFAVR
jgi:hypothetical protein